VRKDPVCKRKKIIFHQDNAPAHKSVLAKGKLRDLHYELLEHPPYSPDLAPSDFYLFPKLKLFLAGQRSSSNQEAIVAVEWYFADLMKNHYSEGIMALSIAGINVLVLREIMLKNKHNFEIINSFFYC
jgi:histone-lysine N-methyltransferase SETMAR